MANDDNEILELACPKCKKSKKGTYKELFGDLPSLRLLPTLQCTQCKVTLELGVVMK